MGSAGSSFIVDNAIIGLAQQLTEAHGNNDDRDSLQRRVPHDGFSVPDDSTNLLRGLRQRNRAMSEVDVFTSFSRLRLELQFGARHSGIADPTRRSKEAPAFAAVSAVVTDDTDEEGALHDPSIWAPRRRPVDDGRKTSLDASWLQAATTRREIN